MKTQSKEFLQVVESRYWRRNDAEVILSAWRASGDSMRAFVERWELNPGRVARWKKRLEDEPDDEAVDFLPVRVVEPSRPAPVEPPRPASTRWVAEVVRRDWTVRVPTGFEGHELARLLRVIEEVESC